MLGSILALPAQSQPALGWGGVCWGSSEAEGIPKGTQSRWLLSPEKLGAEVGNGVQVGDWGGFVWFFFVCFLHFIFIFPTFVNKIGESLKTLSRVSGAAKGPG